MRGYGLARFKTSNMCDEGLESMNSLAKELDIIVSQNEYINVNYASCVLYSICLNRFSILRIL